MVSYLQIDALEPVLELDESRWILIPGKNGQFSGKFGGRATPSPQKG